MRNKTDPKLKTYFWERRDLLVPLGVFLGSLGGILGGLGSLVGGSWEALEAILRPLRGVLVPLGAVLGRPWHAHRINIRVYAKNMIFGIDFDAQKAPQKAPEWSPKRIKILH